MKKFVWKTVKLRIGKGKKKIIAFTVVLCLVAATAGGAITKKNRSNAEEGKAIITSVRTGTIKESVSGTGTISYADTTDIEIPSELDIDEMLVSEGEYVEQGTLLATVDQTSLAVCISDVSEKISSLDDTITSELSDSTTKYITSGVSGTVEKIYGAAGEDVSDVMVEHGALLLVKNGDETIKVVGSSGTITAVNVSEGGSVSSSTKVITLDSDEQSGDYLQAVKDREKLVSILETLIAIKQNGGITASVEGMMETINVTGSSSDMSEVGISANVVGELAASSYEFETAEAISDADYEIHNIATFTLTNLSAFSVTGSGTAPFLYGTTAEKAELLESLKAGTGRIEGTTKDMEYAGEKDSQEWTGCTDEYTDVSAGIWYVRFKATTSENASEAIEIEVTENAEDGRLTDSSKTASSDNDSSSSSNESSKSSSDSNSSSESDSDSSNSSGYTGKTSTIADTDSNSGSGSSVGSGSSTSGSSTESKSGGSTSGSSTGSKSGSSSGGSTERESGSGSGGSTGSKSGSSSGGSTGSKSSSSSGSGSSSSSSGDSSVSMTNAFTIANGDKMTVTMNVDELDILSMKKGLTAEITLDAVENKTFEGTITNVSGSASTGNGSTQYPVEITFDRTQEMLSGMNASVAVIISEAKDVLTVPIAAVADEGRSSYVYTGYDESSGELTGKTEVTLGMSDENSVEIKEGLSEGDTIYYEMQVSESSDSKTGKSGMGGMGMPGMTGSGDMKMGGERPSGGNGGTRSSGSSKGERPSGGRGESK